MEISFHSLTNFPNRKQFTVGYSFEYFNIEAAMTILEGTKARKHAILRCCNAENTNSMRRPPCCLLHANSYLKCTSSDPLNFYTLLQAFFNHPRLLLILMVCSPVPFRGNSICYWKMPRSKGFHILFPGWREARRSRFINQKNSRIASCPATSTKLGTNHSSDN